MKKLITIFVLSLSMLLVATSVANASFSKVFTDGSLNVPEGVTLQTIGGVSPSSLSAGEVSDSTPNSDWGYVTDTHAMVNIGSAKAEAWTTKLYAASKSSAAPPQFVNSLTNWIALQRWAFKADTTGDKTFTLDYTFSQDMRTDVLGEFAGACNAAVLDVYNTTTGGAWNDITDDLTKWIYDGDSYSWQDNGFLSVTGNFGPGDSGYLEFGVKSSAMAYTLIPAPGGVWLWSRRSRRSCF